MADIGGSFLENRYVKFVKDGGTRTQYVRYSGFWPSTMVRHQPTLKPNYLRTIHLFV